MVSWREIPEPQSSALNRTPRLKLDLTAGRDYADSATGFVSTRAEA
jgi:hypothetical protein